MLQIAACRLRTGLSARAATGGALCLCERAALMCKLTMQQQVAKMEQQVTN